MLQDLKELKVIQEETRMVLLVIKVKKDKKVVEPVQDLQVIKDL